ncbi:sensor histidine kinase [Calidifontibacillus oryziterrae]|uniref:sensor histidine kinase n=1 Tax=Calidifontibacillus oryziterrae TaxID=1191699 RepID=UPI000318DAC6|nr:sensor histidine kinase [Calidifontibacillus oryziterrae]
MYFYRFNNKYAKHGIKLIVVIGVIHIFYKTFNQPYNPDYYVLLHPLFGIFTIIVASLIFMQGTFSYKYDNGGFEFIIGLVFFTVGTYEFFHMVTYNNLFSGVNQNYVRSNQWFLTLSRLYESIGICFAFLFKNFLNQLSMNKNNILLSFITFTFTSVALLFSFSEFLPLLISKNGLTSFGIKLVSIIVIFLFLSILILSNCYYLTKNLDYIFIIIGLLLLLLGETVLFKANNNFEMQLLAAHFFDMLGYFFLLKGIFYSKFSRIYLECELVKQELELVKKKLVQTKSSIKRKINKIKENERKRVSQDLHDSIGQTVFAMALELKLLKKNGSDTTINEQIENLELMLGNLKIEVKELAFKLRPSLVEEVGLISALKSLIERINRLYNKKITITYEGFSDHLVNPKVENVIFRICQESITNAMKYAHADQINVSLIESETSLTVMIKDNGRGFLYRPEYYEEKNLGLIGMRERAYSVNGSFSISTEKGKGTIIQVQIPKMESYFKKEL